MKIYMAVNYMPCAASDSFVNNTIVQYFFMFGSWKGFKLLKWPSR